MRRWLGKGFLMVVEEGLGDLGPGSGSRELGVG